MRLYVANTIEPTNKPHKSKSLVLVRRFLTSLPSCPIGAKRSKLLKGIIASRPRSLICRHDHPSPRLLLPSVNVAQLGVDRWYIPRGLANADSMRLLEPASNFA
jgi:hypothetical protein